MLRLDVRAVRLARGARTVEERPAPLDRVLAARALDLPALRAYLRDTSRLVEPPALLPRRLPLLRRLLCASLHLLRPFFVDWANTPQEAYK